MALTTVDALKTFIGLTTTADDTFLDLLLPAVDAEVKRYLDRDIESTSYVDWYGGNGTVVLSLNEYPVTSVTAVREDSTGYYGSVTNSFGTTTALTSGTDYVLSLDGRGQLAEVGRLIRLGGRVWPARFERKQGLLTVAVKPGIGNIKVTYTAGYAAGAIPKDIQLAIWMLCAQIRAARKRGVGYNSESLAEYSYNLQGVVQNALQLGTVRQLLSRYKRIRSRHRVLS